ncbi:MAG TPA: MaoC family dehydratase [Rhodopila sp.]|uniref:MaoC family dehydratase n=1 Tax=Rhodopila sp. TaxID=2480087 RepID=UPI002C78A24A|nr:MaoC family dehydratase [Rhodopila sp.]HVY15220.1 MaoC family dehydratase [Rhodopila sp.]
MTHTFATPPTDRFFEDYVVGATYECGSVHLTEAEIIAFASQYDPQAMHVNPALAAAGPFGEIIASGWQTMGVTMRQVVDNYLPFNGLVAPGVDEVRWTRPVRPGDTLSVRVTVTEARRSSSRPDRGLVHSLVETLNQNGDVVMSFKPMNFVRVRDPQAG